jgi:hypothetical protein
MADLQSVRRRLHNQHLLGEPLASPEEVVRWFGAVQAQESPARAGAAPSAAPDWRRRRSARRSPRARCCARAMRPTWHFVAPADIRWPLGLTSPRVHAADASYYLSS